MSEDRNEPASNTPPPLIPPLVRDPETRVNDTEAGKNASVDAERAANADVDEPVSAHAADSSAEHALEATPPDSRSASEAVRTTGPVSAAAGEHDAAAHPVAAQPIATRETAGQSTGDEPMAGQPTAAQPTVVLPRDEPTRQQPTVPAAPQPQRVFVPPVPVAPKKRGNRGIGSLIAVLSVIVFAAVYAIVSGIIIAVRAPGDAFEVSLRFLTDPVFYVPAIFFVAGFVIVVLLVNRSGWWAHVIGSLVVAAVVYFGTIGFQLVADGGFGLTPSEANARFLAYAANPFVIAAALVARETALWIGAIISSRGRRMKTRNATARADFERATAEHRAEYERAYLPAS